MQPSAKEVRRSEANGKEGASQEPSASEVVGLLGVFEDRGLKPVVESPEAPRAVEHREPDPFALPRPPRRDPFPTSYVAPAPTLTPEERRLLLGAEAGCQEAAGEERPAGMMQPSKPKPSPSRTLPGSVPLLDARAGPSAATGKEHPAGATQPAKPNPAPSPPLPTYIPLPNAGPASRAAAGSERPAGIMQPPKTSAAPSPPSQAAPAGLARMVGMTKHRKRRRTVDELCQEEDELRQRIAAGPSIQEVTPPIVKVEPPSLGTFRSTQRTPQQAVDLPRPPAQQPGDPGAVPGPQAAAPRSPADVGLHGIIARKKPRRMLDDLDGGEGQPAGEGAGSAPPQQASYQRFPGQQRGKEDGSRSGWRSAKVVPADAVRAPSPLQHALPPAAPDPPRPPQGAPPAGAPPAAPASGQAGAAQGPPAAGAGLSPLHAEMLEYTALVTPSQEEKELVAKCAAAVAASVSRLWPFASTHVFGSQAVDLAMPGSDVDICILDAIDTEPYSNKTTKQMQTASLRQLKSQLQKDRLVDHNFSVVLISAKVPIIKCNIKAPGAARSVKTDISLGVSNGVKAVEGIRGYMQAMPPLRPLVLAAKALVKGKRLHEVHTGGISSFSLVNMAIAHLMAEGYRLPGQPQPEAVRDVNKDLGHLLWGFLVRFGKVFDYYDQAVAINQGGVIRKKSEWRIRFKAYLLAIEDPNVPGVDIAGGTYQIQRVVSLFAESADKLTVAVEGEMGRRQEAEEQLAWDRIQEEGKHRSDRPRQAFPILSSILDLG